MITLYTDKHTCNYYCDPPRSVHTFLGIDMHGRSLEQLEAVYRAKMGDDLLSVRVATEADIAMAETSVYLPSGYVRTAACTVYLVTGYCLLDPYGDR